MGNTPSMKEQIRSQKRIVDRSVRSLERERTKLAREQQKLIAEIKATAKKGHINVAKRHAKELVRVRKAEEKFITLGAQLRAISIQMTTMASTNSLMDAMKEVTKSMERLNMQLKLPELNTITRQFAKQTEQMEMKGEIMNDSIDDVMDDAGDEKESDDIVNQVLDEIGIQTSASLVDAPQAKEMATTEPLTASTNTKDHELANRLGNL